MSHDQEAGKEPDIDFESIQKERRRVRIRLQRNVAITMVIVLVVITALILVIWRSRHSASDAESEIPPVVRVRVTKVDRGNISAPVLAIGTIWPREKADVAAKISAPIRHMALLKNKLVRAGEVIAVLESRDLQAQRAEAIAALNEAQANERSIITGTIPKTNAEDQKALMEARANFNNARAVYERRRVLFDQGGISQKDLEQSHLDLTTTEAELKLQEQTLALRTQSLNPNDRALAAARTAQAQQRVATLEAQLSYATVKAPITGIVTDQFQYEGEFASEGGKLVTIADTSSVIVKAPFPDTVAGQLKTGDVAAVVATDGSTEEMHGQVTLLGRSSDPSNRTIEVWITLGNGAGTLRANGAAQVIVSANSKNDAILVPTSAVTLESSNADEGTVIVIDSENIAHETKVITGIRTPETIEIVEGLKGGEIVVVEGNYALPDGAKVKIAADEETEEDTEKTDAKH